MFKYLLDKLGTVIGHEAERQNAIARFGTGKAIDRDGMVVDPRDTTKKMHVDDYGKLPAGDRMKDIADQMTRMSAVKQIRPEDLDGAGVAELLKSSFRSDDKIGRTMAQGDAAVNATGIAQKAQTANKASPVDSGAEVTQKPQSVNEAFKNSFFTKDELSKMEANSAQASAKANVLANGPLMTMLRSGQEAEAAPKMGMRLG